MKKLKKNPNSKKRKHQKHLHQQLHQKQSPPTTAPAKEDNYPEAVEKRYHNIAKMDSIGVLNAEKELCDRIIEYKKNW